MGAIPSAKIAWRGRIISVQPRIRLLRSFDERWHTYLGYVVGVSGRYGTEEREFLVAIGPAAQRKHGLRVGDAVSGRSEPIGDAEREIAELHKTAALRIGDRGAEQPGSAPPWHGAAPPLEINRARGHRRLDARTYQTKCASCTWGCRMPVEMIIDHWESGEEGVPLRDVLLRPEVLPLYRAGATRKVPGRRGMVYEEENWVDEEETSHRGPDD